MVTLLSTKACWGFSICWIFDLADVCLPPLNPLKWEGRKEVETGKDVELGVEEARWSVELYLGLKGDEGMSWVGACSAHVKKECLKP